MSAGAGGGDRETLSVTSAPLEARVEGSRKRVFAFPGALALIGAAAGSKSGCGPNAGSGGDGSSSLISSLLAGLFPPTSTLLLDLNLIEVNAQAIPPAERRVTRPA